jgi:hypothetical protein
MEDDKVEDDKVEDEKIESCKPQRPSCESCVFAAQFEHPGERPAAKPTTVTRRFRWFKWQAPVAWDIAFLDADRLDRWEKRVLCCRYPLAVEKLKKSLCGEYIREEEHA